MMYRVMIVDDEPLILAGIASMIDWAAQNVEIISKAANGQQALEQMKEQRPDIVITDIKMPGMNGLELMRSAREQGYDEIAFILLTNLEEFQLAKEALHLGAVDYLVKMELTEEKLRESLQHAIAKCGAREQREATEQLSPALNAQKCVEHLLVGDAFGEGANWTSAEQYLKRPVAVLINFDYGYRQYTERFTREEQRKILMFAEDIIGQMVKGYFDAYTLLHRGIDGLLLVVSTDQIESYQDKLKNMMTRLSSVVKDYFEVPVSLAVSERKESLKEFEMMLYEAMTAMNYHFSHAEDTIVFYTSEIEAKSAHTSNFHIGIVRHDIYMAVMANDGTKLSEIINQVIRLLEEYRPPKEQAVNACANLYFYTSMLFSTEESAFPYEVNIMEKLGQMGTLEQIVEWISMFRDAVTRALDERTDQKTDVMAAKACSYVREHYPEKLTLGQVAEALGISAGYLSTVFSKHVGESFSTYVAEVKVEKAKEMLKEHQYMMYEISDRLGFENPFYFSKVFKKFAGVSPKEYEAQCAFSKKR